jgi:hypothetical protein
MKDEMEILGDIVSPADDGDESESLRDRSWLRHYPIVEFVEVAEPLGRSDRSRSRRLPQIRSRPGQQISQHSHFRRNPGMQRRIHIGRE